VLITELPSRDKECVFFILFLCSEYVTTAIECSVVIWPATMWGQAIVMVHIVCQSVCHT